MNIITELILILLGIAVLYAVVMFQIVVLARIYRTWSWWAGMATFILLGTRQIYGLVTFPSLVLQAQLRGQMIERLTIDQWVSVIWNYVIVSGFIVWLDWMRRDLKKIGV